MVLLEAFPLIPSSSFLLFPTREEEEEEEIDAALPLISVPKPRRQATEDDIEFSKDAKTIDVPKPSPDKIVVEVDDEVDIEDDEASVLKSSLKIAV